MNSPFARCVRHNESHDGADPNARGNLYGVKVFDREHPSGWYGWASGIPRATQDLIAYRLWQRYGDQPWRFYDGCTWIGR